MEGHADAIPSNGGTWHPRITPYRLAFMLVTAGLGIAKTILVYKGSTNSSTTVEWISGVVVALCFQFMNSLENTAPGSDSRLPKFIFTYDCSAILWKVISRPPYSDEEDLPEPSTGLPLSVSSPTSSPPPTSPLVTPYRLLISSVTIAFGGAKMICAYMGLSGAMNALDWAISVPLALILYYIGLFETNTANKGVWFFKKNSSQNLILFVSCVSLLIFVLITAVCSYYLIRSFWGRLHEALDLDLKDFRSAPSIDSWFAKFESFHDLSVKACAVTFFASGVVVGFLPVIFALAMLWDPLRAIGALALTGLINVLRTLFGTTTSSAARSMCETFVQGLPQFSYVVQILLHLYGLFFLVDIIAMLLGLAIRLFSGSIFLSLFCVIICEPAMRMLYNLILSLSSMVNG